jgi:hypothetical protein
LSIATTSLPFPGKIFNWIITNVYNLSLYRFAARVTEVRQECQYAPQIASRQVSDAISWLWTAKDRGNLCPDNRALLELCRNFRDVRIVRRRWLRGLIGKTDLLDSLGQSGANAVSFFAGDTLGRLLEIAGVIP